MARDVLGPVTFPADGSEAWFEYQDGEQRRRLAFHDYAAIYAVPGLYERVFYDELGMCSAETVVGAYADALRQLGRAPESERVLDVGAGNGIGGERIRALGVAHITGLDLEPWARVAALRDRPGVYDDYVVGDLLTLELDALRARGFTAVLALSAVGVGHLPAPALERVLGLLEPGGLFAFAVTPALMPDSTDPEGVATGYPEVLDRLPIRSRTEYVHRRQADGTPHDAVALVGQSLSGSTGA